MENQEIVLGVTPPGPNRPHTNNPGMKMKNKCFRKDWKYMVEVGQK